MSIVILFLLLHTLSRITFWRVGQLYKFEQSINQSISKETIKPLERELYRNVQFIKTSLSPPLYEDLNGAV